MMKKAAFLIFLFLMTLNGVGQGLMHYPEVWVAPAPGPEKYYIDSLKKVSSGHTWLPGIRYRLNLGTSFTSGGWSGSGFQTWVAPELSYRMNERWNFRAGAMISHNFASPGAMDSPGISGKTDQLSGFDFLIYAGTDYRVNSQLIISADVMKSVARKSEFNYFSPGYGNFESYALSFNYKLSRSMSIGANFRFSRGNEPFGYYPLSPYSRNYFGPPPFGY